MADQRLSMNFPAGQGKPKPVPLGKKDDPIANFKNQAAQAKSISDKYEILNICYRRKTNLEQLKRDFLNLHNDHIAELKNIQRSMNNMTRTIDLISVVATGFAKVGFAAGRAIKASGESLLKLNQELASKTLDMAYKPITTMAKDELTNKYPKQEDTIKFAFALLENSKNIFGFVGDLFDLTNPSFYAKLYLKYYNGIDPETEIKEMIRNAQDQKMKSMRNIDDKILEISIIIDKLQNELRGSTDLYNPKRQYA